MLAAIKLLAQAINPDELEIPKASLDTRVGSGSTLTDALQLVLAIAGAIAFLIIVIAGLRYTLSEGNPQSTSKAKNTIIYASIGLLIIALAFSIVRFVVGRFS